MSEQSVPRRHIVRRLYDWVLHWAETPYGTPALGVLAFAESSFFPVPPDPLLIALDLGKPKRSFYFALICSIASVVGGMFGYLIGMGLWHLLADFFFAYIPGFTPEVFAKVQTMYNEYGFAAVLIAGFSPIPYKVFVLASAVSRSARFFLVSTLIYLFGEPIKRFIDRYFDLLSVAFVVLVVLGFVAIKYLF